MIMLTVEISSALYICQSLCKVFTYLILLNLIIAIWNWYIIPILQVRKLSFGANNLHNIPQLLSIRQVWNLFWLQFTVLKQNKQLSVTTKRTNIYKPTHTRKKYIQMLNVISSVCLDYLWYFIYLFI